MQLLRVSSFSLTTALGLCLGLRSLRRGLYPLEIDFRTPLHEEKVSYLVRFPAYDVIMMSQLFSGLLEDDSHLLRLHSEDEYLRLGVELQVSHGLPLRLMAGIRVMLAQSLGRYTPIPWLYLLTDHRYAEALGGIHGPVSSLESDLYRQ